MIIRTIETEMESTKQMYSKNGIENEEFDAAYKAAEEEVLAIEPSKTGDALVRQVCRRLKQKLNKRNQQNIETKNCFIFARLPDNDFNRRAIINAKKYEADNGEEAAINAGYKNSNGEYTFTGGFNEGEVIDPKQIWGTALGICQDEKGNNEGRVISINNRFIDDAIPIGVELELDYVEGKKPNNNLFTDNNQLYYQGHKVTDGDFLSIEAINACETAIKKLLGDVIFESYNEFEDAIANDLDNKVNVYGVNAACIEIGVVPDPTLDGNERIPISFEIGDPLVDAQCQTLWVPLNIFKSLNIKDGAYGILMLNGYEYKDDIRYNVVGFLPLKED